MKKPRKRTQRGTKYDALAHGYRLLNSPLAETYTATAEHFNETDPPVDQRERPLEPKQAAED